MSEEPKTLTSFHDTEKTTLKNYVIGFTLSAYLLVVNHAVSGKWALAIVVGALALIQFVVQITLFLHLGQEAKPKFKLLVFSFMLLVVIILVGGSIWIMYNLNYRQQLTPSQVNQYLKSQDGGF